MPFFVFRLLGAHSDIQIQPRLYLTAAHWPIRRHPPKGIPPRDGSPAERRRAVRHGGGVFSCYSCYSCHFCYCYWLTVYNAYSCSGSSGSSGSSGTVVAPYASSYELRYKLPGAEYPPLIGRPISI